MRYYLDTEFCEDGKRIRLISIALAAEDGRNFYAINEKYDRGRCNDWVVANVLPKLQLPGQEPLVLPRAAIAKALLEFIGEDRRPQFWAYCAAYDWVVVAQLFGMMIHLPHHFPFFCHEIVQECERHGLRKGNLPKQDQATEHNALADAQWDKLVHELCLAQERKVK